MNEITIQYGDIALGAKEHLAAQTTDKLSFVDLTELNQYNLKVENYANPCELYQALLDGSQIPLDGGRKGYWSNSVSGSDGAFENDVVITFTADNEKYFTSSGVNLIFDTYNNIYATELTVTWYRDNEVLSFAEDGNTVTEKTFYPDSSMYMCNNAVTDFNKIVLKFKKINMPNNRLKIIGIDYGFGTVFLNEYLSQVSVIQEIDPISTTIPINTMDITLDIRDDLKYAFQIKQPVSIFQNGNLIQKAWIETAKRVSKFQWQLSCIDLIGVLSYNTYYGKDFSQMTFEEIIADIFDGTDIPYLLDDSLKNVAIPNSLGVVNAREALMQVCYAGGAMVDTACKEYVYIRPSPISSTESDVLPEGTAVKHIPLERIYDDQKIIEDDVVTEVVVNSHKWELVYDPNKEYSDIIEFRIPDDFIGKEYMYIFEKPIRLFSVSTTTLYFNLKGYEFTPHYIKVVVLKSKDYEAGRTAEVKIKCDTNMRDTTVPMSRKNARIFRNDLQNTKTIDKAMLVSEQNQLACLNRTYNYLTRNNYISARIKEGRKRLRYGKPKYGEVTYGGFVYDEKIYPGDVLSIETEYSGVYTGMLTSARYKLLGGFIVKECTIK